MDDLSLFMETLSGFKYYFKHLPWYGYILVAVFAVSYVIQKVPAVKKLFPFLKKVKLGVGKYSKNPKAAKLTDQQKKALGVGAINSEQTSCYINSLETGLNKQNLQQSLQDWWGITDSATAKQTLDWLYEEGHRFYYDRIFPIIERQTKDRWNDSIKAYFSSDEEKLQKAGEYVTNLTETIGELRLKDKISEDAFERGILAWDMGRMVTVARLCFDMGFINQDEAWSYINKAYKESRNIFSNWQDLANSYIIGRAMWSGDDMALVGIKSIARGLLDSANSPWSKVKL